MKNTINSLKDSFKNFKENKSEKIKKISQAATVAALLCLGNGCANDVKKHDQEVALLAEHGYSQETLAFLNKYLNGGSIDMKQAKNFSDIFQKLTPTDQKRLLKNMENGSLQISNSRNNTLHFMFDLMEQSPLHNQLDVSFFINNTHLDKAIIDRAFEFTDTQTREQIKNEIIKKGGHLSFLLEQQQNLNLPDDFFSKKIVQLSAWLDYATLNNTIQRYGELNSAWLYDKDLFKKMAFMRNGRNNAQPTMELLNVFKNQGVNVNLFMDKDFFLEGMSDEVFYYFMVLMENGHVNGENSEYSDALYNIIDSEFMRELHNKKSHDEKFISIFKKSVRKYEMRKGIQNGKDLSHYGITSNGVEKIS